MSQGLENLYESLTGAEVEAEKAAQQPEQEQKPEQTEEVKDEGVKVEETAPPAESQAPAKDERFIPINALLDEREKRQRLEAELAQYKAKEAQPAKEDAPSIEDELFTNPVAVLNRVYQASRMDMINMSEAILFETKPDAQEKIDAFKEAVQQNPTLYQQMLQHPNPAGFAYQEGSKFLSVKSMPQDMAAYEKELRAKIEAELAAKYGQKGGKLPSSIPTTLSDVPNVKPEADDAPDALDIGAILKAARR